MKTRITSLIIFLLMITSSLLSAQNVVTVTATDNEISDNLNLEAIATLFGESKNLQQFEEKLNEPKYRISNLDLNNDGYVDYIRVVEHYENNEYLVTLQDVIGQDLYQDIATIDVGKNNYGQISVQIVGNPYFYGANYIIEPIYTRRPLIFSYFWNPYYSLWSSPYYWNRFPRYYRPWHIYSTYQYKRNIHRYIRPSYYYRYPTYRMSHNTSIYFNKWRRNDFERRNPSMSFTYKHKDVKNHYELNKRRNSSNNYVRSGSSVNWKDNNVRSNPRRDNNSNTNRVVKRNNNTQTRKVTGRSPVKVRVAPSESYKPERSRTVRTTNTSTSKTNVNRAPRTTKNQNNYTNTNRNTNRNTVKRSKSSSENKKTRTERAKPEKKEKKEKR
ncbi:MAG: hypothetical protein JXR65_01095 [Bacteroidales bacterium]|nr:hypothetical protein [Bacteroidales bacterium]